MSHYVKASLCNQLTFDYDVRPDVGNTQTRIVLLSFDAMCVDGDYVERPLYFTVNTFCKMMFATKTNRTGNDPVLNY